GSCVLSAPKAGAWNQCAIPAVSVTGGAMYKLALLQPTGSTGTIRYRWGSGSIQTYGSSSTTLAALPNPWVNGPNWGSQNASIYANNTTAPPPPAAPTAAFTYSPASP